MPQVVNSCSDPEDPEQDRGRRVLPDVPGERPRSLGNAVPLGDEDLVQVALAPLEPASHLESDETDLEALPASHPERRSSTRHVANLLLEEPDAWKPASPDLWGPRAW